MMRAELDGVICSGARRGRQFTYALLDERVPPSRPLPREEALAELTRRYFTSHGPAQVQDFSWWSGLTIADARAGLALVDAGLRMTLSAARPTGSPRRCRQAPGRQNRVLFAVRQYRSPTRIAAPRSVSTLERIAGRDSFVAPLVVSGRFAGRWRSTLKKSRVVVRLAPKRRTARSPLR